MKFCYAANFNFATSKLYNFTFNKLPKIYLDTDVVTVFKTFHL